MTSIRRNVRICHLMPSYAILPPPGPYSYPCWFPNPIPTPSLSHPNPTPCPLHQTNPPFPLPIPRSLFQSTPSSPSPKLTPHRPHRQLAKTSPLGPRREIPHLLRGNRRHRRRLRLPLHHLRCSRQPQPLPTFAPGNRRRTGILLEK